MFSSAFRIFFIAVVVTVEQEAVADRPASDEVEELVFLQTQSKLETVIESARQSKKDKVVVSKEELYTQFSKRQIRQMRMLNLAERLESKTSTVPKDRAQHRLARRQRALKKHGKLHPVGHAANKSNTKSNTKEETLTKQRVKTNADKRRLHHQAAGCEEEAVDCDVSPVASHSHVVKAAAANVNKQQQTAITQMGQEHVPQQASDEGCSWDCYLERYPALKIEVDGDLDKARNHYINHGGRALGMNCRCHSDQVENQLIASTKADEQSEKAKGRTEETEEDIFKSWTAEVAQPDTTEERRKAYLLAGFYQNLGFSILLSLGIAAACWYAYFHFSSSHGVSRFTDLTDFLFDLF